MAVRFLPCTGDRAKLADGVEQLGDADVLSLAAVQKIGITVPAARALGRAPASSSAADVAFEQVFLHQGFVALDDGVDELGAGGGEIDRAAGRRVTRAG